MDNIMYRGLRYDLRLGVIELGETIFLGYPGCCPGSAINNYC
jgi:hypothetical protein